MNISSQFSMNEINHAQSALHHAVQFIAVAGKYLLEEQADDSHTNMEWAKDSECFFGGLINNRAKVGLHVPSFSLKVFGPKNFELATLQLIGKTKEEGLLWLKQALQLKQMNAENLEMKLHYDIPDHETDSGKPFPEIDTQLLQELGNHRSFADQICNAIAKKYEHASPVRTWPHHFDHGTYIPFKFDNDGNATQSFSVGYAIADSVIDEPYLYVTQWKKDGKVDYSSAPKLKFGEWLPEKLKGAALRLSEITRADGQQKIVDEFLERTSKWST